MLQVYLEVYKDLKKIKSVTERVLLMSQDLKQVQNSLADNQIKKFFTQIRVEFLVSGLTAETEKVYTGMETSLTRLIKYIDGDVPEGADWHKRLLDIAASENPGVRGPIISRHSLKFFDRLRAFRHKLRHVYEMDIDPKVAIEMADSLAKAYSHFFEDVSKFHKWVEPNLSVEILNPIVGSLRLDSNLERE